MIEKEDRALVAHMAATLALGFMNRVFDWDTIVVSSVRMAEELVKEVNLHVHETLSELPQREKDNDLP